MKSHLLYPLLIRSRLRAYSLEQIFAILRVRREEKLSEIATNGVHVGVPTSIRLKQHPSSVFSVPVPPISAGGVQNRKAVTE
jgi:hypothetical protein